MCVISKICPEKFFNFLILDSEIIVVLNDAWAEPR